MGPQVLQLYQSIVNNLTQLVVLITALLGLGRLVQLIRRRRNSQLALLSGPPSTNILWGRLLEIIASTDTGPIFEEWANKYGPVFKIPAWFGSSHVILCDSKAIAHFHAADNSKYVRPPFINKFQRLLLGDSMTTVEPDDHSRLRRILTPAFSITALRDLNGVFYDSAYRVKGQWDALFESNHEIVIDVQQWMHRMTLDVIGIAGFEHDFKASNGHRSPVTEAYDTIYKIEDPRAYQYFYLLGIQFPQIVNLPLKSAKIYRRIREALREIALNLLDNAGKTNETSVSDTVKDRSIIGLLFKGQVADAKSRKLSLEEVIGQCLLLFAGYETTAISISWGLIELARHPHVQEKLRKELRQISNSDPTWDQLMSGLPYLDAVAREVLRLHPAADLIIRVASEDDIIPLSAPMETASGQIIEQIHIPKGTVVVSPIGYSNCCEATWGSDARKFAPERWLKENTDDFKEQGGIRRLYTFSDGPRSCIGKVFAMAEFKAALSVLVRNFSFELVDGPGTKIEVFKPRLPPRPKIAGEVGSPLPMRVKQVTGY